MQGGFMAGMQALQTMHAYTQVKSQQRTSLPCKASMPLLHLTSTSFLAITKSLRYSLHDWGILCIVSLLRSCLPCLPQLQRWLYDKLIECIMCKWDTIQWGWDQQAVPNLQHLQQGLKVTA